MPYRFLPFAAALWLLSACDSSEPLSVDPVAGAGTLEAPAAEELVFGAATGGPSEVGTWGEVLDWPFVAVSMATLPNGQVLTYSGSERRTWPTTEQTYSAVWDPETGIFEENLHQGHNMFCAAMSMTADGKVLVNGGRNQGNSPWTTLFDYSNNEWQTIDNMASGGRWYPTSLATGDGKVMTALGTSSNTRNPDLWDPDSGWRVLNGIDFLSMRTRNNELGRENAFPLLSVAPNGNIYHYWDTTENQMINPLGSGLARSANPTTDGFNHAGGVQFMYDVGKLISTGRNDGSWGGNATGASKDAFTIDLNGAVPDIRSTSDMIHPRKYQQLVPFPTGEVMVVGGNTTGHKFRDSGSVLEPEVWNPRTGQWRGMANMAVPRDYHSTAMLLTDGRIITAGGGFSANNANSAGTHQDAQIFSPPYLYASDGSLAVRPQVTATQPSVDAGDAVQVSTTGEIDYFSLIRMSATTHSMNTDARFYKPEFESTGTNQYAVTVHQNPNVSIPGYWMLFAVDVNGVPSEAQVIRITALDTRLENLALQGIATQSSNKDTSGEFDALKAIDGDLSGSEAAGSLSQTATETSAWWEVDLGRIVDIDTIRVWNRTDCCSDRLADFHVMVSEQPFVSTDLNLTIAQNGVLDFHTTGTAGRQTDVKVAAQGRYVRVQLAGSNPLQLAEVQVFGSKRSDITNLAMEGAVSQSSTYLNSAIFNASNAIDGSTNGNRSNDNRAVSHTGLDLNAWWELDLGRIVDIDSVIIWNRTDCCTGRLANFNLLVSDVPFNSKDLDNTISQSGVMHRVASSAVIPKAEMVVGRTGRYVRVQLRSGNTPLHMAEVQVMGAELDAPLNIQPLTVTPTQQGNAVTFTADATGSGALQYRWNFGDGNLDTAFSSSPAVTHTFENPGRYVVSLMVRDGSGEELRSTFTQVVHAPVLATLPKASTGIVEHSTRSQVWNVNPDNNTVGVIDTQSLSLLAEIEVGNNPVSLAEAPDGSMWVVNRGSADISVVDSSSLAVIATHPLQRASQPYGIVINDDGALVALQAVGKIQRVALDGTTGISADVGENPRHLSINAAGDTVYVSRYITSMLPGEDTANVTVYDGADAFGGEVLVLDATTLTTNDTIVMQHIYRIASEHEGPGVPNYLGPAVISPAGDVAWLPSKQDNILAGDLRGGTGMTFDQTVRAVTSKINLATNKEELMRRIDHDNASVAGHSAFDPYGVTIFTSLEGNRQVSVIDASTAIEIGRFDTGRAPQSITVSKDGKRIYVHNFMDRTVGVYDIENITQTGSSTTSELATINVVSAEVLEATVLRGKQLFYDARDDRLAGLDYMSCASCHVDGEHDGRTWDFTSVGEGLRNTITLKGRAGTGHGILHWTGNFDEIQDFEGQIREFAGGTGLMNDADFLATEPTLGAAKAGLSTDLDALAAYISSLDKVDESPWRNADGTMTAAGLNGESLFVSKGCATCHSGIEFTDSNDALLHDIGTLMPESGLRLGGPLTGLDTPTLKGVWRTAPYLHDGSAATLEDAIAAHTSINVTATEQADLASYLLQLDDGAAVPVTPPVPPQPPTTGNGVSNPLNGTVILVDGNLSEWATVASFGSDPDDTTGVNTIDWAEASIAHDDQNFYVGYSNHGPAQESWGYGTYIDTDSNSNTGFKGFSAELPIGSDYLIEGRVVLKYTGTGSNWSWEEIGTTGYAVNGDSVELMVPRSLLGNPTTLRMYFNGNNTAVGGNVVDFYPDAVTDASQADSDRYFTYTIANTGGNSPPIANAQVFSVNANGQLNVVLAGSDSDADDLQFEIVDQPANGTLVGTAPALVYQPTAGFIGTDSFAFTVNDGSATSAPATVNISVVGDTPNNQTTITVDGNLADWAAVDSFGIDPVDATSTGDVIDWLEGWVAHDSSNFYFAYQNNNPVVLTWGYAIYIDADNNPATGFRNFDGSYPIGADYIIESNDLQKYTGTGNNWSWSSVALGAIQAVGNNVELSVERSLLGNPTEMALFFVGENAAVNGTTIDYYPDNVVDTAAPVRFFTYNAGEANANAAPVAVSQNLTLDENSTLAVTLAASDANGDQLSYQVTRQPANGTLTGTLPNVVYAPTSGFSGSDSFEFRASDATSNSDPAVVTLTINPANPGNENGSNLVASITIDGNLQDWAGLTPLASDSTDITGTAEKIDWRQGYVAHSNTMLYLSYQNDVPMSQLTYGHAAFIGTDDSNATGFRGFSAELPFGADYLLEGTDLYRYAGSGSNWLWTYIATVNTQQVGNIAEIGLSRVQLGNPQAIEIFWRGNNEAVGGTGVDYYPDAANDNTAPIEQRRFRYVLQP